MSRTRLYDQFHRWVRLRLGWKGFTDAVQSSLAAYLTGATQTQYTVNDLVNASVEWLRDRRIELPALSTLKRMCGSANAASTAAIDHKIASRLDAHKRGLLDALLDRQPGQLAAPWVRIRQRPEAAAPTAIKEYIDFADWVWSIGDLAHALVGLPKPRVRHLAAQARELAPSDLANFTNLDHRYAVMTAALVEAQAGARDTLAIYFCKRLKQFEKQAHADLDELHREQRLLVVRIVTLCKQFLAALKAFKARALFTALWNLVRSVGSLD